MTIRKKVIFISGGTSGIGLELARLYIAQGHDIALFHVSPKADVVAQLNSECIDEKQRVVSYLGDISNSSVCVANIEQAVEELGAPAMAINSAGVVIGSEFSALSHQAFDDVIRVNLGGSRNFASALIPHLGAESQLVFVSSLAGLTTCYGYAAYCASKYAVIGLAGVLRTELKPKNIHVSVVCPPEVDTPMVTEELKSIHPATRAMKDFAGTLAVEPACKEIVKSLEERKYMIIPGFKAKFTYLLENLLPQFFTHYVADRITAKALKK